MPRGKKFGKPKPAASTTPGASSSPELYQGHPLRQIADRIDRIGKEIREITGEIWRERQQTDLFARADQKEIREGDSTRARDD